MKDSKRLLIAVDDSEPSHKAVAYVSAMIEGRPGCYVCLLHGLPQGPPFEHGGSEDPRREDILETNLQKKRAEWIKREQQSVQPMLEQAKELLRKAHVPEDAMTIQFASAYNVDALVTEILDAAQANNCDTIVVGRETFTGLDRIFKHHVADDLIRRGRGYTIWVVE
ncbi:MAG TPA: universal stress protein [Candidatus Binatia bacterium]